MTQMSSNPQMSFGAAVSTCFRKYATFKGRARRSEYWYWVLFNILVAFALMAIDHSAHLIVLENVGILTTLFTLVVFVPNIAVTVRRLHDIGRSGWWYWIYFIPILGSIVLLVFCVIDSKPEENEYGVSPKYGVESL